MQMTDSPASQVAVVAAPTQWVALVHRVPMVEMAGSKVVTQQEAAEAEQVVRLAPTVSSKMVAMAAMASPVTSAAHRAIMAEVAQVVAPATTRKVKHGAAPLD
jgi:hypothetical protein